MKIVITNVFGPLNQGDYELFRILAKYLTRPGIEIAAIAREPELCSQHFSNIFFYEQLGKYSNKNFSKNNLIRLFYLFCCICYPFFSLNIFLPRSQRTAIEVIRNADLVIACPGGFLEDSSFSLYPHLVQLLLPILFRKKVILAPMSIGPVDNIFARLILKFILNRVDRIYVREKISQRFCDHMMINCKIANDLAFTEITKIEEKNYTEDIMIRQKKYIAVTAINWNFPKCRSSQEAKDIYIKSMVKLLNIMSQKTGLSISFIVQVETDIPMIKAINNKLSVSSEIRYDLNSPILIENFLKESFCMIASRFHSCIFALRVGCPVVALGYLPKTMGMLELYNMTELYRPIHNFNPDEVANSLLSLGTDRKSFQAKIYQNIKQQMEIIGSDFFNYLDFLIDN